MKNKNITQWKILILITFRICQCVEQFQINDLMTTQTSYSGWVKSSDQTPFTSQYQCSETKVGSFLGPIQYSVEKTFTNLPEHYQLEYSVDILFMNYWNGGFFYLYIDSQEYGFQQDPIYTTNFAFDSQYCSQNVNSYQEQLKSISTILTHSANTLTIQFTATFNTDPIVNIIESFAIQNLIINLSLCHYSCITCSSSASNACLTCPYGSAINGLCTCPYGYYSLNHQCVSDCGIAYYQNQNNNYCTLNCRMYCDTCSIYNDQCLKCIDGYYFLYYSCVSVCPENFIIINNKCVIDSDFPDLDVEPQTVLFTSTYHLIDQISSASINSGSVFSFQKPYPQYSIYNGKLLFGGPGVWSDGTLYIGSLPYQMSAHYQIRLYFEAWFIDNWNNEQLNINVDGSTVFTITISNSDSQNNLFYRDNNDQIKQIKLVLLHTSENQFSLEVDIPTTTQYAYAKSLGIRNFYFFVDYCPTGCIVCFTKMCTTCDSGYDLFPNGNCDYCLYPPNNRNPDCSCLTGYFEDYINNACQQCESQCETCITTSTTCQTCQLNSHLTNIPLCNNCDVGYQFNNFICTLCDSTINRNSDCTCLDHYYDDNINLSCQICLSNCNLCNDGLTCSSCQLNSHFTLISNCTLCEDGYYLDSNSCYLCDQNCNTCSGGLSTNCLSCSNNLILQGDYTCGYCQIGQFQDQTTNQCQDCANNCSICTSNSNNCVQCSENRIYPPTCQCQNGYFEDSQFTCTMCNIICQTCQTTDSNCLVCAGQHINPPLCDCPQGQVAITGTSLCKDCSIISLDIQFSDDLVTVVITLSKIIQKVHQSCSYLFTEETLYLFGDNPDCFIYSTQIIIKLGQNPTIYYGSKINFNSGILYLELCPEPLTIFNDNLISTPSIIQSPQIQFSQDFVQLYECQEKESKLYILQTSYTGNQQLVLINWILLSSTTQENAVINFINELNNRIIQSNTIFYIPYNILSKGNSVQAQLNFKNYLGQLGKSVITFQQNSQQISFTSSIQQEPFRIWQPIIATFLLMNCNLQSTDTYQITLIFNKTLKKSEIFTGQNIEFFQSPNSLVIGTYDITATIYDQNNKIVASQKLNFVVIPSEEQLILITESTSISSIQTLIVIAQLNNPSSCQLQNIMWECYDMNQQQLCVNNKDNSNLQFNNGQQLTIKSNTFNYDDQILLIATCALLKETIQITFKDEYVPQLKIITKPNILSSYINFYDSIQFQFQFPQIQTNSDNLTFICTFMNDMNITKTINFNSFYFQFKINEYFDIFNLSVNNQFQITIKNPLYLTPSQSQLPYKLNIPPQNCSIIIDPQNGISMETQFQIFINNCYDINQPLKYKLILYQNQVDLDYDNKQGYINKGITLFDYQYEDSFLTILPGNGQIILMIYLKDTLNGITNLTTTVQIIKGEQPFPANKIEDSNIFTLLLAIIDSNFFTIDDFTYYQSFYYRIFNISSQQNNISNFEYNLQIQLKTFIANKVQFQNNNIYQEIIIVDNNLTTIFQNLTKNQQISLLNYDQSNNQIQNQEIYEFYFKLSQYLGYLYYQLNNQTQNIISADQNLIKSGNEIVIHSVNTISQIQLTQQVLNSKPLTLETISFNVTTQKQTKKILEEYLNQSISTLNQSDSYTYQLLNYSFNPYFYSNEFQNLSTNTTNYPLYNLSIMNSQDKSITLEAQSILQYTFDKASEIAECVVQVQGAWSLDVCKKIQVDDKTSCQCEELSPVSMVDVLLELAQEAANFFTLYTLLKIFQLNFFELIFTYIIIVYSVFFIWFLYYGRKLDNLVENSQHAASIFPIGIKQEKEFEQIDSAIPRGDIESQKNINNAIQQEPENKNDINSTPTKNVKQNSYTKTIEIDKNINKLIENSDQNAQSSPVLLKQENELEEINSAASKQKTIFFPKNINNKLEQMKLRKDIIRLNTFINQDNQQDEVNENKNKEEVQSRQSIKISGQSTSQLIQISSSKNIQNLRNQIENKTLTQYKIILILFQITHKILSLYFVYDEKQSRIYRAVLQYVSMMGQIAIFIYFGTVINLNTVIVLSLLQTVFGFIYKTFFFILLSKKKKILNIIGFIIAIGSVIFFNFIILGSMATKFVSLNQATIMGLAYLSTVILEYGVYALIYCVILFGVIKKFDYHKRVKQILKLILTENIYNLIYGVDQ